MTDEELVKDTERWYRNKHGEPYYIEDDAKSVKTSRSSADSLFEELELVK